MAQPGMDAVFTRSAYALRGCAARLDLMLMDPNGIHDEELVSLLDESESTLQALADRAHPDRVWIPGSPRLVQRVHGGRLDLGSDIDQIRARMKTRDLSRVELRALARRLWGHSEAELGMAADLEAGRSVA